jgi:hypothetical protein
MLFKRLTFGIVRTTSRYLHRTSQHFPAVPDNIRQVLISRYEYVVAEKDVVPDLTDTLRLCATCSEWCAKCVVDGGDIYILCIF